jgi:hypothetical protein
LRNLKIPHNSQTVDVTLYKNSSEDTTINTKHIIKQKNFTNTNLNTIEKQLSRINKQISKTIVSPVETTKYVDQKLKTQY